MKLSKNMKKLSLFTVAGVTVAGVFTAALLGGLSVFKEDEQSYIKISSPDKQYTIYEDDIQFKNEISTFDSTETNPSGETSLDYWYAKGLEIAFYEYTLTEIWGYDTAFLSSISSFNDLFTSGWEVAASTGTMINIDEDAEDDIYVPGTSSIDSLKSLWDSIAISTIYQDTMMSDLSYNDYIIQHSTNNPNLIIAANRDVGIGKNWATGQLAKDLPDIFSIKNTGAGGTGTAPSLASDLQAMWELGLHTVNPDDGGSLYQLTSDSDLRLEILDKMLVYSFLYQEVGTNSSYDSYLTAYMYLKKPYMVWQMTYANSDKLAESADSPSNYIPTSWDDWNSYYNGSLAPDSTVENKKGKTKRFISPVGKDSATADLANDYTYGFEGIQFSSEVIPNITDSDFNNDATKYWNAWTYSTSTLPSDPDQVWSLGGLYDLTNSSGEYVSKPTILGDGDDKLQIPAQDGIVSAGMPIYPKPQGVGDYNTTKDTFPTYSYSTSWAAGDVTDSTGSSPEPTDIWEVIGFDDDKYAQAYIVSSLIDSDASISNSAHSYWRELGYYIELSGDFERLSSYISPDILNSDEQ